MKAIVNVNKESGYAIFNGLTFDVVELQSRLIGLRINGSIVTDFTYKEVIIVDIQQVVFNKMVESRFSANAKKDLENLKRYCTINNVMST